MNNAINTNKFSFDNNVRMKYRKKFNFDNSIVLLHVGRFSAEKNHIFMVDIFDRLSKLKENYLLVFVGYGKTETYVRKYVNEKGLSSNVMFLGERSDVAELMNAADVFLLPSMYEGFGITLIEAQSVGLVVFASDNVPVETQLTNLIEYLPLNNIDTWVSKILKIDSYVRKSRHHEIEEGGYSIEIESLKYEKWIMSIYDKHLNERV